MPHVRIEMLLGKSLEYKRSLLNEIHESIVEVLKTPAHDRYQKIIEIEKEHFDHGPRRSDDYLFIEIFLFAGRKKQTKELLYKRITERLQTTLGLAPIDIIIVLREIARENWGFGGVAGDKVELSFEVEI